VGFGNGWHFVVSVKVNGEEKEEERNPFPANLCWHI
jgi:hypothetical protein